MKQYVVGGWVRDKLLGIEPNDKDFVVVGSTPEEMLSLGYERVGQAFPVFLHPVTKDEYALARTEKKVGNGYTGFDVNANPDITLEEDLMRRDFSINSIAYDEDTGQYIDPYGGIDDLKNKVLRHTSDAFSDDPLRVLRALRLAAKYDLTIAPETSRLLDKVVASADFKHLSEERFIVELEKVLSSNSYHYFKLAAEYEVYLYYYGPEFAGSFLCNAFKLPIKDTIPKDNYQDLFKKFSKVKLEMAILYNGVKPLFLQRIDAEVKHLVVAYANNFTLLNQIIESFETNDLYKLYQKTDFSRRPYVLQYMFLFRNSSMWTRIDKTVEDSIFNLFNSYKRALATHAFDNMSVPEILEYKARLFASIKETI